MRAMLPISELMRHEIVAVAPDAQIRRVVEIMVDTGVEEVLVIDGRGRVVGSVGDDQLVAGLHASRSRSWWGRLRSDDGGARPQQRLSSLAAAGLMLRRGFPLGPPPPPTAALARLHECGGGGTPGARHRGRV